MRSPARFALAAWLLAGLAAWAVAPRLVASIYESADGRGLSRLLEQRALVPLEVYQLKARSWVILATLFGLAIAGAVIAMGAARHSRRWRTAVFALAWPCALALLFEIATRGVLAARGVDIEIYRNFSFLPSPRLFVHDRELGHRMLPAVERNALASEFSVLYRTNRLGLREREIDATPGPRMRVLFLGDSQTFGWGVEAHDRFSDRIGAALPAIEPINAGVPGWGIHQMRQWLVRDGLGLEPDLVVVAVIAGDFQRALRARLPAELQAEPGAVVPLPGEQGKEPEAIRRRQLEQASLGGQLAELGRATLGRSWLIAFARTQIEVRLRRRDLEAGERRAGELARASWERYGWADRDEALRAVGAEELGLLAEATRAASVPLLLVWIDATASAWEIELAVRREIDFVDLSPELAARPELSFRIDPHYNAAGHARIAGALLPILRDRYLASFRPERRASGKLDRRATETVAH